MPTQTKKPIDSQKGTSPHHHLTPTELRAIAFVSTLILAGITVALRVDFPVVWTFLGVAIGTAFGQSRG